MEKRRYGKNNDAGVKFAESQSCDGFIHVSYGPHVHGHVPGTPEYGYVVGIPPISVELAVCELQQLTHKVQERMEG